MLVLSEGLLSTELVTGRQVPKHKGRLSLRDTSSTDTPGGGLDQVQAVSANIDDRGVAVTMVDGPRRSTAILHRSQVLRLCVLGGVLHHHDLPRRVCQIHRRPAPLTILPGIIQLASLLQPS